MGLQRRPEKLAPKPVLGPPLFATANQSSDQGVCPPLSQSGSSSALENCQLSGSLKRAHHFGLKRAANFGEQLILQDSVTQSMSSPVLSPAPGGAAALAAGDKLLLSGAACWGPAGGAAWPVRGAGLGSS